MPSVNEVWCISQRKLPIALAKINITPKMKKEQPELSERLLTYQDKCADVLASVFIDNQTASDINMQSITNALTSVANTLTTFTQTIASLQQEINEIKKSHQKPKRKWSYWSSKMYPKYQLLTEYFQISNSELYKNLYIELQNMYPDIDLNQIIDDYCYKNNLDSVIRNMINKFVENHKLSQSAHEEITSMTHSDEEIAEFFHEHELYMTNKIAKILIENGFNEKNLPEKVHISINLIDDLCHEIVYHKHKQINYDIMIDLVINTIVDLINK